MVLWHRFAKAPTMSDEGVEDDRSFVHFILRPMYKLIGACVSLDASQLREVCKRAHIRLSTAEAATSTQLLLKTVLHRHGGGKALCAAAVLDVVTLVIPSPLAEGSVQRIVSLHCAVSPTHPIAAAVAACDPNGPLVLYLARFEPRRGAAAPDGAVILDAWVVVLSGTVRLGMPALVLGTTRESDIACSLSELFIPRGRAQPRVKAVSAGGWVLIGGLARAASRGATIVAPHLAQSAAPMRDLHSQCTQAIARVAVEPIDPPDLPKVCIASI